jgi:hypothetical protein
MEAREPEKWMRDDESLRKNTRAVPLKIFHVTK